MSKLAKHIDAKVFYNDSRPLKLNLPKYFEVEQAISHLKVEREYRVAIGVKFEQSVWLSEVEIQNTGAALERAKVKVKQAMIEELFGEFRPLILDLQVAAYEQDYQKVRELVDKLEHQMFFEDV